MELNGKSAGALRAQAIIDKFGCLPNLSPLTELAGFSPVELAQAIEKNLEEAAVYGNTKITIHLDLPDAYALAQALRRD